MSVILLFLCATTQASAAQASVVATVLFSQGIVTAVSQNSSRALHKGDSIAVGDTINTGVGGRIQMRFSDGGLVSLQPDSSFVVDKYNQPTTNSEGSLAFDLIKGGLRTLSGTIGHLNHDNYQLKTSVATLGIRGTQFIVLMDGQTMRVHVGHGEVSLYNQFGQLLIPAGQNGMVLPGQSPRLSFVVPQFDNASTGKQVNRQQTDDQKPDGQNIQHLVSTLAPALDKSLAANFLLGKGGEGGFAFAQVTSLALTGPVLWSNQPDIPGSFSITGIEYSLIKAAAEAKGADTSTWPANLDFGNPSAVTASPPNVNVTNGLVWGESDPTTAPAGALASQIYKDYVIGAPATHMPLSGSLNYYLVPGAVTPMRNTDGSSDVLSTFDLTVTFGKQPAFQAALATQTGASLTMGNPVGGEWTGPASFSFKTDSSTGGVSDCTPCSLDVAGILSGDGAANAGVTYRVVSDDNVAHTGAAILSTTLP
jgi:hypothetical protein